MPGGYLALLGANGAGKSTLLNILAMLTCLTQGSLELFGKPVLRGDVNARARIGMIGHQPMLYRDLSARENLVFFGKLFRVANTNKRATQLLERIGLADRGDDQVRTFSRGMVQRIAIARALMHDPQLIFADEPFSGLDVPSVRTLESILGQLHDEGKTIVLVNHDIAQSLRLAQRIIILRQGRIVCDQLTRHSDVEGITREVIGV